MSNLATLTREQLIELVKDQEKQITELRLERINTQQKLSGYANTIRDLRKKLRGAKG
jgi:hypothetical protein